MLFTARQTSVAGPSNFHLRLLNSKILMFDLPTEIPALPDRHDVHVAWSANVSRAHEVMSDVYRHAIRVLRQDDCEPLQLMFHIDAVLSDAIPLLEALEESEGETGHKFPKTWLHHCAELYGKLVLCLRETAKKMKIQSVQYAILKPADRAYMCAC